MKRKRVELEQQAQNSSPQVGSLRQEKAIPIPCSSHHFVLQHLICPASLPRKQPFLLPVVPAGYVSRFLDGSGRLVKVSGQIGWKNKML